MSTSYSPIIGSEHFYWNVASKEGSVTSQDFVATTGRPVPQSFYIKSEKTGKKAMFTRFDSTKGSWLYRILDSNDYDALEEWTVLIKFAA